MDYLEHANDGWLKPRLLMALVRERLPDDRRPLGDTFRFSSVLSLVRVHGLLSESHSRGALGRDDKKLAGAWTVAVDTWVERCLTLCRNKMPDKCWTGISLLGFTCELCASDRFLASYPTWFEALLSNLQPLADSHLVKLASCASMSDLFTRLSTFPNVKKDATSLASKLVLPVLQLMSDNSTDAILVGAADLLGAFLKFFPFSLRRHYGKAEAVIVSNLMSQKCSMDISKKLAYCLALLPMVGGDENSWIAIMQKVLISINMYLNEAFRGLEEEHRSTEVMRLLVPPGKDPPSPLGGQSLSSSVASKTAASIQEVLVPRVSMLMDSCCIMITYPYSIQVNLPVQSLILLVERVLSVDGSLHETLSSFTSELHQELLCAELPTLHLSSLDLLIAIVKSMQSQLLPYAANVTRILTEYLNRATLPCLRIKVYSIMEVLLTTMGVGMALYLGEEIINNAFDDLNCFSDENRKGSSNLDQPNVLVRSRVHGKSKKRKYGSGAPKDLQIVVDLGEKSVNRTLGAPLSVQISALETLETLLTVAGSLKAECWRQDVDQLLISVATDACSVGPDNERKRSMLEWDSYYAWADFKLAALRALLASLLSHSHIRSPYFSQGLELFYRGKQEIGTKVAAFCTRAMLALEVLIHPRSLSLMDSPAQRGSDFNRIISNQPGSMFLAGRKSNFFPDPRETPQVVDDSALANDDGEPYNTCLDGREEGSTGATKVDERMEDAVKTTGTILEPQPGIGVVFPSLAEDKDDDEPGNTQEEPSMNADSSDGKKIKLVSSEETAMYKGGDIQGGGDVPPESHVLSTQGIMRLSNDSRSPSLDSLPDIVDADPDSD
ncbi:unnamed protein product [Spirodela intermedia]|uniref:Pre-rRNA-processing protein RIX1 N-terminal domain-containing protein n=1 Tax=Spirodela intermedia TaxID=51605 RepID=A0A7I8KGH7_SPIIN|nr:unnamed protein product [Spirodela intermedia]